VYRITKKPKRNYVVLANFWYKENAENISREKKGLISTYIKLRSALYFDTITYIVIKFIF
jgi:hypothetical protein